MERIGYGAFAYCDSLLTIVIPYSVTIIDRYAFSKCGAVENIIIPESTISIGWFAFYDCKSLKNINYRGTSSQWKEISKGEDWDRNTGDYTIIYNYDVVHQ